MQSRIPLPTDNIYKFYSLFGLLLFITSIVGAIYANISFSEKVYELVKEHEHHSNKSDTKSALPVLLETIIDVQIQNKKFFTPAFGIIAGIAVCLMFYGFRKWHTVIQPKQDEYFDLQISRLKQEIEAANK